MIWNQIFTLINYFDFLSFCQMQKSIKLRHLRYSSCEGGDLHEGELMTLVCVDSNCQHRGLICPVCKLLSHEGHSVIPVKTFLQEVQNCFPGGSRLSTLGQNLRILGLTRDSILSSLRKQADALAQLLREMECEMEQSYLALRRNVLLQAGLATKLPGLVEMMEQGGRDGYELRTEFQKYCELIIFRDGKMHASEGSEKLVEGYSNVVNNLAIEMKVHFQHYAKIMRDSLKLLNINAIQDEAHRQKIKFSNTLKSAEIIVSQWQNVIETKEGSGLGFICLESPFSELMPSVTLQIEKNTSKEIFLGLGKPGLLQQFSFKGKQAVSTLDPFIVSTSQTNLNWDHQSDEDSNPNPKPDCFSFNQPTLTLLVGYNPISNRVEFTKDGVKYELRPRHPQQEDWRLTVGLGQGDRISIKKQV